MISFLNRLSRSKAMTKVALNGMTAAILIGITGCSVIQATDHQVPEDTDGIVSETINNEDEPYMTYPDAAAVEACRVKNGKYQKVGRLQSYQCIITYKDSGQTCQDATDCAGECYSDGHLPVGMSGQSGQCASTSNVFGCRQRINHGIASPILCID